MAQWWEIRSVIIDKVGVELRLATEAQITQLQTLNVAEEALSFFREAEPKGPAEIENSSSDRHLSRIQFSPAFFPGARAHGNTIRSPIHDRLSNGP